MGASAKKSMGLQLARLLHFTFRAIRQDPAGVSSEGGPKLTSHESFGDFGVAKMEHSGVGEANQRLPCSWGYKDTGWDIIWGVKVKTVTACDSWNGIHCAQEVGVLRLFLYPFFDAGGNWFVKSIVHSRRCIGEAMIGIAFGLPRSQFWHYDQARDAPWIGAFLHNRSSSNEPSYHK